MIANYYTLRFIAADLKHRLNGGFITSAFSQNKNELVIVCHKDDSTPELFLVALCEPSRNALYLRPAFARKKRNTIELFLQVRGKRLSDLFLLPDDREVRFLLESEHQIAVQMFGSKANVILTDSAGDILGTFLRPNELKGTTMRDSARPIPVIAHAAGLSEFLRRSERDVFSSLKECFPLLGSTLIRELLFRAGLRENEEAAVQPMERIEQLFTCFNDLCDELRTAPSPRIYYPEAKPPIFSIVELRMFGNIKTESFSSVHDAVRSFLAVSHQQRDTIREKTNLSDLIDRELQRAEKSLSKMASEQESEERAQSYEMMGRLLMTNLHQMRKGMKSIVLENVFSPAKEEVTITLDSAVPPSKNGERYFEKAKKARHAAAETRERRQELEKRSRELRSLREAMEQLKTPEQWKDFELVNTAELQALGIKVRESHEKEAEIPPFRIFRVEGGFEVWAGKRNDNNDLLTFKYARPNDLWFHARGASGSHVVLRSGTGKGEISRKAIEQAAAIAAYYSKMKTSGLVPVAVTERKYVRKPRGAPAGTVAIQREKVLMVKPGIPRDTDHDRIGE